MTKSEDTDPAAEATLRRHRRVAEALEGTRLLDWSDWAVAIHDAQALTSEGRRAALWAVETLRQTLGDDFPARTQAAGDHPLFWSNLWPINDVAWVYANLFQLAAHLCLFREHHPANRFGRVIKTLRANLQPIAWCSSLLQLEVAGLGQRAGWDVVFEPPLGRGRSADVELRQKGVTLLLETTSMRQSDTEQQASRFLNTLSQRLLHIEVTHHIRFAGVFGEAHTQTLTELERWLYSIELAAQLSEQDGVIRVVNGPAGGSLQVYPESSVSTLLSLEISGPLIESRPVDRLIARLNEKNRQAEHSSKPVWVRLDEYAGLWAATRFQGQPLEALLIDLAPLLQHHLMAFPHLAGVVVAPAVLWNAGGAPESIHARFAYGDQTCRAVRCPLPGNRVRETLLIPRPDSENAAEEALLFAAWYAQEETWLDWALHSVHLPPFATLMAQGGIPAKTAPSFPAAVRSERPTNTPESEGAVKTNLLEVEQKNE